MALLAIGWNRVVVIDWNAWSSSIGTPGRHHPVRAPIDPARVLRTLFGESNRENEVVEQTLGYAEHSQEAARQVGPASKPFGEQTLAALVAAAAIGFVLGVLWKRR
jgi:hypothetical protein